MKLNKIALLVGLILLSGCQQIHQTRSEYLRNRSLDYMKSRLVAPLKVPEGLSMPPASVLFPIPGDLPPMGSLEPVSLVPPGFGVLSNSPLAGVNDV